MRIVKPVYLAVLVAGLSWIPQAARGGVEEPVLLDPGAAVTLLAEADDSPYEDADRLVIFDSTTVEVEETGLSHVYQHRLVKVLAFDGARAMRALRFDYDPASNLIDIRGVRIYRSDSTSVDIDPAAAADETAPAEYIYWGGRMRVLALPPLEPGDAVETITYKKGFQIAYLEEGEASGTAAGGEGDERYIPPMRGHFYDVVLFQEETPMLEKVYVVRLPRDKPLQYSLYNGEVMSSLRFTEDEFIYAFWHEDIPAMEDEPRVADPPDLLPKVVMATVPDWPEKSRWFYQANE